MFKNLLRIFYFIIIILIIFVSYLSIFGIKTNKFNELIKSQIAKQDKRIDLKLQDVYFKLNIKERSFSLNSQDVDLLILKEKQKISNVNILIGLGILIKQENEIKKIIINSKENKIKDLFKFIRAYRLNLPALYLENITKKGDIVYDIIINFKKNNIDQIELAGKINDAKIHIYGNEQIENLNFNFTYRNKNFEINNLKLNYKDTQFISEYIVSNFKDDKINIKGNFNNKINLNLLSSLINLDLKKNLNENILLSSKSNFEILLNNKFKIQDYNLESKIDLENIKINLDDNILKNYITKFANSVTVNNGVLDLKINKKNEIEIIVNSQYFFDKKNQPKDFMFNYSKIKSIEKYKLNIDLSGYEFKLDQINFLKTADEKLYLDAYLTKNNNIYNLEYINLFNKKNKFNLKNIKFTENLKIDDFELINATYQNKDDFINDISIKKKNRNIILNANNFDLSLNIEKILKGKNNENLFDVFENLNSKLNINIKSAKLDNEYNLKNLNGSMLIKKNNIDKASITGKYDDEKNFIFTKDEVEGQKVTTIFSDLAKPFVKKFDFIKGFEDGKFDFTSTEINENLSEAELRIYDFKLQDMPILTKLLSLASLQGIADLATGEGIRFNEFEMFFENSKELIKIDEIYALGPAISILMEGYIEKNNLVSLRGTLVPATTINKSIAKIPLLGNILVGEKTGEGVFGVSFKIKGPPNQLEAKVNPIKTLTPRFITRTLNKIKNSK